MHKKILILDFGSQVTQPIARRVREQQVYCEIHPYDVSDDFIRSFAPEGIILSGGPNSVYEAGEVKAPMAVFEIGVPVFGICYGMQTMAAQLGGKVESSGKREFGYAEIRARGHGERGHRLPPGEVVRSRPRAVGVAIGALSDHYMIGDADRIEAGRFAEQTNFTRR